ncbi:PLP-dependent aminotransferase family protein [Jiella sp. MQZ9-1]|uniref:PLP-dependent aminotransferase family protein n=1 Tax=Jiella flava TaxID=2816857 RepID=A0A939FWP8_9HYPH|nr:PLP-dependent aminotransferase family protein [Jiella flava]MBO0662880.1 PLP-dependent aminotransferase family protein [Jiella flava]MCD2471360.1 PLP-dependent aminotransferase family protein [Jiella flava]
MLDWIPEIRRDGKPLYLEIADKLESDIRIGKLKAGERLPPQRRLAKRLAIDFTTVSRAYAEAQTRGLVDSHVGRGTFVAPPAGRTDRVDPDRAASEDATMNMPPETRDAALIGKMRAGLDYVGANLVSLLRYQSPTGSVKDKIAASSWLSMRGMVPKLERIAVTPGAHATMTAVLSLKTEPGDTVLCEAITYPGFRGIAKLLRLNVVGLPMDAAGIRPDALDAAIRRHRPKMLYVNPTLQNPTTITMPTDRRLAVAEILNDRQLPAIEDDAYGFIPPKAPAPLAVSAPDLIWHIGGLAKCIGAGLRLAFTVAPSGTDANALTQALRAASGMASPISVALATHWIEDGTADGIRRFIRAESAARQSMAADLLAGLDFAADPYAFNIWLRLPPGRYGRADVMGRLANRHLAAMPSDSFTVLGQPQEALRICLGGSITRDELVADLRFLASALNARDWFS